MAEYSGKGRLIGFYSYESKDKETEKLVPKFVYLVLNGKRNEKKQYEKGAAVIEITEQTNVIPDFLFDSPVAYDLEQTIYENYDAATKKKSSSVKNVYSNIHLIDKTEGKK